MIRTGITYRFKQRVTEAGIFPVFLRVLPVEWPYHGAGAARKKAGFCIFMAAAACVIIY
ncbi:hypothetical protein A1Y1_02349 [Escherichia coli KTE115]|nr:hypothetical protein A1Y1_02349 [Escherichia coli KTE115]STI99185.1 Uncharacterised protein [Escherichia coli]STJ01801.1 Uncharacterised protein [Escherichia coli]